MQLFYNGDFSELKKLKYNESKYGLYFFKTIDRWGAIFIDTRTRKITIENCAEDNPNAIEELEKIKEFIKEVEDNDTRR